MADSIDEAIRDYVTGNLERKIQIRELSLTAKAPEENIGGSRTHNHEAEQARLIEKLDSDMKLVKWRNQLVMVPLWLKSVDNVTHDIIIKRFKYDKTWWQIELESEIKERAAKDRYADFKRTILEWTD